MGQVCKIPPPAPNRRYMVFVISDLHSHHMDRPTFNIYMNHARIAKANGCQILTVIAGDYLDAAFLMKSKNENYARNLKNMNGLDEYFVPEARAEIEWGNQTLDYIQSVSDQVVFMQGNHDWRYGEFMRTDCPHDYRHNFDLDKRLNLEKRNISHIMYNDWLDIGKYLTITHGMFHGTTALKKHYEACGGKNVIFGHVHKAESKAFPCRGNTIMAWSNPCMSTLNPHYIKNTDNNWVHGYTTVAMRSDGKFNLQQHIVIDRMLTLSDGTEIHG